MVKKLMQLTVIIFEQSTQPQATFDGMAMS